MLQILMARAKAGVDVRVIGKVESKWDLKGEKLGRRVHVRAIIRDGSRAFIGSQSLRKLELEKRREVGVIVDDREGGPSDGQRLRRRLGDDGIRQESREKRAEGRFVASVDDCRLSTVDFMLRPVSVAGPSRRPSPIR